MHKEGTLRRENSKMIGSYPSSGWKNWPSYGNCSPTPEHPTICRSLPSQKPWRTTLPRGTPATNITNGVAIIRASIKKSLGTPRDCCNWRIRSTQYTPPDFSTVFSIGYSPPGCVLEHRLELRGSCSCFAPDDSLSKKVLRYDNKKQDENLRLK